MAASALFTERVYEIVARIPHGRVTTYGDVARAIGSVRGARMVGWALHAVPEGHGLPCHRVVNRYGGLSGGWHFGHPDIMKALLVAEGVPFADEYQVDLLAVCGCPGRKRTAHPPPTKWTISTRSPAVRIVDG